MVWSARTQLSAFAVHTQCVVYGGDHPGGGGGGGGGHAGVGGEFLGCECGVVWAFQGVGYDVSEW